MPCWRHHYSGKDSLHLLAEALFWLICRISLLGYHQFRPQGPSSGLGLHWSPAVSLLDIYQNMKQSFQLENDIHLPLRRAL